MAAALIPESFGMRNVYAQLPQLLLLKMKHEWKSVVGHDDDDDPYCQHSYHQDALRNSFEIN